MSTYIRDTMEEHFPLNITPSVAAEVIKYTTSFEVANINALSTPYLGIVPIKFKDAYKQEFFDIFNIEEGTVSRLFNTNKAGSFAGVALSALTSDIKRGIISEEKEYREQGISTATINKVIKTIPSINTNFKVVSDPFNLFTNYVVYKFITSDLPEKLKHDAAAATLKLLQYKYFTSLVNYRFRFKPSEAVMQTTIEQLSDRFDIRKYGTWKNVMDARVADMLGDSSLHKKTINTFADDKAVLYLITDFQTRIRNQLNIFVEEYMRVKETGDVMGSYSSTGTDSESGEKVLLDHEDELTSVILKIYTDSLTTSRWLFDPAIRITASLFTAMNTNQFKKYLIAYSEYSVVKNNQGLKEEVKEQNGEVLYIGPYIFVHQTIQQLIRYCLKTNVNIKKPVEVLKAVKGVMSSSRVSDPGILAVRASSRYICEQISLTDRGATVSAFTIGLAIYILLLVMKEMK